MVVHLNFLDVRPRCRDMMHDRIGEPAIVGTNGGKDDLHEGRALCGVTVFWEV